MMANFRAWGIGLPCARNEYLCVETLDQNLKAYE